MLKGISTKIVKRIVDTAARTVQVVANEGIGSAIKKIHLYNGIRPHAILKGVDEFGNKYYEDGEKAETVSLRTRWVELNAENKQSVNPSAVPPEWHAWLHHICDSTPEEIPRPDPFFKREYRRTDLSKMASEANYVPPGYLVKPKDIKEDTVYSLKRYKSWNPTSIRKTNDTNSNNKTTQ